MADLAPPHNRKWCGVTLNNHRYSAQDFAITVHHQITFGFLESGSPAFLRCRRSFTGFVVRRRTLQLSYDWTPSLQDGSVSAAPLGAG